MSEAAMPRFFFDFDLGDGSLPDDEGVEFPDLPAARQEGVVALVEMARCVFAETAHRRIGLVIRQCGAPKLRLTLALDGETILSGDPQRSDEQP